jgi:hypothetical protein
MRRTLAGVAALTCLLLFVPGAIAKDVGQPCLADKVEANRTLVVFNGRDVPLMQPVVPEEPPQVITSWSVHVATGLGSLPQRLEVYRVLNEERDFRKEAAGATEIVREGGNRFATRIPVDSFTGYLALYGPSGTFACSLQPHPAGSFEGSANIGETRKIESVSGLGVPLTVTVEDDKDKDGYGDETQDRCPQSALFQTECPTTTLQVSGVAKERSILVEARIGGAQAEVDVWGQVGWGYKPNPKLKTAGDKPTRLIISLAAPRPKTLSAGKRVTFRVPLRKAVLRRLDRLPPSQSVTAKLTAGATNLAGKVTYKRLFIVLHGRQGE